MSFILLEMRVSVEMRDSTLRETVIFFRIL